MDLKSGPSACKLRTRVLTLYYLNGTTFSDVNVTNDSVGIRTRLYGVLPTTLVLKSIPGRSFPGSTCLKHVFTGTTLVWTS